MFKTLVLIIFHTHAYKHKMKTYIFIFLENYFLIYLIITDFVQSFSVTFILNILRELRC